MILVVCILASCESLPPPANHSEPYFSPEAGFTGKSRGVGTLDLVFQKPQSFIVESIGYDQADGTFRLDQTISFEGEPTSTRHWLLTSSDNGQHVGKLSDAAGPVSGHSEGSRLTLRYRVKGPIFIHQVLDLQPNGETIKNVGRVTMLGIPVGTLQETITRLE